MADVLTFLAGLVDYRFAILCLFIAGILTFLLLPTPEERREDRLEDLRRTRRRR